MIHDSGISLPDRAAKPRQEGLTMVIDGGLPLHQFQDLIASNHAHIDFVKFGWGTALVTSTLSAKLAWLRQHRIDFFFGGTLFEKFLSQDRIGPFVELCHEHGCRYIEVSNGTWPLANAEKARYIRRLSSQFRVISEVGFKDVRLASEMAAAEWVDDINQDLDAGAHLVITEARESGRSGICYPDGRLRMDLIDGILDSGIDPRKLLFEAPTKDLQTYFVARLGSNVNLGNINPNEVVALETLRLGLRADTFFAFDPGTVGVRA
jgi:phosphosulfolactate synthase